MPVTWFGRFTTITYSLFGIPLFLVMLAESGLLMTRVIKFGWVYSVFFSRTVTGQRFLGSTLLAVLWHHKTKS